MLRQASDEWITEMTWLRPKTEAFDFDGRFYDVSHAAPQPKVVGWPMRSWLRSAPPGIGAEIQVFLKILIHHALALLVRASAMRYHEEDKSARCLLSVKSR